MVVVGNKRRVRINFCMQCGAEFDAATGIGNNAEPSPDAIAICIDCGHVQVFDENLCFRAMTVDEAINVKNDVNVQLALYAIKKIREQ